MNPEPNENETYTNFVNDECGDTMWDKVLAQKENLKIFNILFVCLVVINIKKCHQSLYKK